jgi:hypothetical protein
MAGDTLTVILDTCAGEFDRAKRRPEIRALLVAGTTIAL